MAWARQPLVCFVSCFVPFFGSRIQPRCRLWNSAFGWLFCYCWEAFPRKLSYSFYCWFRIRYLWFYFSPLVFQKRMLKQVWYEWLYSSQFYSLVNTSSAFSGRTSLLSSLFKPYLISALWLLFFKCLSFVFFTESFPCLFNFTSIES